MSDLEMQLEKIMNIKGVTYFYYYTEECGKELLERGLMIHKPNLHSISYELSDSDKSNIMEILDYNYQKVERLNEKGFVVLIACDEDFEIQLVKDNIEDLEIDEPHFIICPEYLLACVDLNNGELTLNDRSLLLGDMHTL